MKGLSICFSIALLFVAQGLASYLKRVRAKANLSPVRSASNLTSLVTSRFERVHNYARPNMAPPELPRRPDQSPFGPDIFTAL